MVGGMKRSITFKQHANDSYEVLSLKNTTTLNKGNILCQKSVNALISDGYDITIK